MKTISIRVGMMGLALAVGAGAAGCDKKETPRQETPTVKADTPQADTPKPAGNAKLAEAKGTYTIDTVHSAVVFSAKHAGLGWTYGSFNQLSGKLVVDEDPSKSSIELEIDANSVFTANKKRDDHLKSPDFFNTAQFPKITFKSRSIKASGESKFDVEGDLTLHGVTKPLTVSMEHVGQGVFPMDKSYRVGFEGSTTIKRSDFGMKSMLEAAGDDVRFTVAIEAVRE
ncbi:MAG: polyisoprenoid-binding protein [Polyangiaceae bacterium]|nr:polyisoprenoid-binding protein [Polyangiaceae bacterium]